ncbi:MAG: hypothetical protein WA888_19655 [Burkholderiaceae bacterium]
MKSLSACYCHSQASTYNNRLSTMLPFILIALLAVALIALWASARYAARGPVPVDEKAKPYLQANPAGQELINPPSVPAADSSAEIDLRELQARLRTRESVIKRLMGSADASDALVAEQKRQLQDTGEALTRQESELREREARLGQIEPLLAQGQQQISALQQRLQQVGMLESELSDKNLRIGQLRNRVSHLDSLATVLAEQISALRPQAERSARLSSELEERDQIMAQLEAAAEKTVSELQLTLHNKDEKISELNNAAKHISALESTLHDKDKKIFQLNTAIEQLEESVADSKSRLAKMESEIESVDALRNEFNVQADHVAGLESEIRERDDLVNELQVQTEKLQNNKDSDVLKQELEEQAEKVSILETEIREKGQLIIDLQAQDNEIEKLRLALVSREQKFNQVQAQLLALASVQETLEDREQTIVEQNLELERLAALASAVEEKDRELAQLREATDQLKASQLKASHLRSALTKANHLAIAAEHGATEVQRLRDELHSLGRGQLPETNSGEESTTTDETSIIDENPELDNETAWQIKARIDDLERLEADTESREKKIADLKKRLTTLSNINRKTVAAKRASGKRKPAKSNGAAKRTNLEPLFEAPNERDDLKKIHGIGPVLEKTLNHLGVTTYQQLASFKEEDISRVTEALGMIPNRIERDDWVGGARKALAQSRGAH